MEFLKNCLTYFTGFFSQYPTKIFLVEILFCLKKERRKYFWLRFIPCVLFFLIIWPYFIGYFHSWSVLGGWFVLAFAVQYVFSLFLMWFCFELKWQQVLFYGSSAYAIEHACNALIIILRLVITGSMSPLLFGFLRMLLMCTYYGMMYFMFIRHIVKLNNSAIKSLYVWAVSFITVVITNLLSQWMAYVGNDIYHNLYDWLLCILLLISQYGLFSISEMVAKNRDMKLILHLSEKQHKVYKENIDFVNQKCHDIKHQIVAIRTQGDSHLAEDSLKQIEKSIMIYDSMFKTGNPALDVILTEKKFICEKYGIQLSFIVEGKSLDFMEEEDIYVLFGNALDNAIENVMKIEEETDRIITIRLQSKGELLTLHIDNVCRYELKFKNGLPVTTKQNAHFHGYGMRSIRYIAEKYGGNVEVFVKDEMFNLNIIIPIPKAKNDV